jgi:predicted nucleic acid-binding protein
MLPIEEAISLDGYFKFIKRKYALDLNTPFHTYHILENGLTCLNNKSAMEFNKSISEFIKISPIALKIVHAKKSEFRQIIGFDEDREQLYNLAATKLFYWFAQHLEKENSHGQVVVDSRKGNDLELLAAFYNIKENFERNNPTYKHLANIATKRLTSITFSNKSDLNGGLEIVDLISYSFFQFLDKKRRIDRYFKIKLNSVVKAIKQECNPDYYTLLTEVDYIDILKKPASKKRAQKNRPLLSVPL